MLAKVNEMNKNAVIFLSVVIMAVTAIIITLIVTSGPSKGSAGALKDFQKAFVSEYGVKPDVTIMVTTESEEDAKGIAGDFSKELRLEVKDTGKKDINGNPFFITHNNDESFWVHSAYKNK